MISVIVPVYNVEEYLEECLESIQNQTNPYQKLYEDKLREYIKLVEKSPEVARSSKMIWMYQLSPKHYLRYTFPIVNRIWRKMHSLKELIFKGE